MTEAARLGRGAPTVSARAEEFPLIHGRVVLVTPEADPAEFVLRGAGDVVLLCLDTGARRLVRPPCLVDASVSFRIDAALLPPDVLSALGPVAGIDLRGDVNARGAAAIIASVARNPPEPGTAMAAELEAVLIEQLCAIVRSIGLRTAEDPDAQSGIYGRVRSLLAADPRRRDASSAALAAELGVTRSDLLRAVAAQGTSLRGVVQDVRLESIAVMLCAVDSARSVSDIAQAGGFQGPTQAARAFKNRFGLTMTQYRTVMRL